ncbi:MAG: hypothetical protein E6K82_18180 [Candidatus Rokuibacteriota bacterium]|nr:MAG: hypothetical protein E6K82_18180 [Candidatus Rokubacteria bacterium]
MRAKLLVAGLIVLALLGVFCASLLREATTTSRTAGATARRPSLTPPRPALTPAEEAYAQALWAIHGDVKSAAYKLTFSGLRYKLKQADGPEFGTGVRDASKSFGQVEARVRALAPPPSLRQVHAQYLDAVHLFQRSAAEMLKVTADGRDDHLLAAHPLSQEASETLLRVGNMIWPGEYLPN